MAVFPDKRIHASVGNKHGPGGIKRSHLSIAIDELIEKQLPS